MSRVRLAWALALLLACAPAAPSIAATVTGLRPVQLFDLAEQAKSKGRIADAEALYQALAQDPDPQVRAEARFRHAMMLAGLRRYKPAAVLLRALLDEQPGAARARLELARILALMGDESAARRELRQAQAQGLPPDVALVVDQFARALHSTQRFGGSLALAMAPDSNINRATASQTLDTIIAPLTLSKNARQQSGLGLDGAAQAFARVPLAADLDLVPRVSAQADVYRQSQFDDVSGSALVGLEWRDGRDRISPSLGATWRWYGGAVYAHTQTIALDWIHPIGSRTQVDVQASAARARYDLNPLQTGGLFAASASYERALTPSSGVSFTVDGARETARDAGYATWSGGGTALAWRDLGRATVFASLSGHRLESDARLFLFTDRRREWLITAAAGATVRRLTWNGFAPLVRISYERNFSTVALYDYRRVATSFGVTRAF